MKSADLAQLPPDFGVMDYSSTHQDDYRNPNPSITKQVRVTAVFAVYSSFLFNAKLDFKHCLTVNHGKSSLATEPCHTFGPDAQPWHGTAARRLSVP